VQTIAWHDNHELWYTTNTQLRAVALDGTDRLVTELPGLVTLEAIARDGRVLLARRDSVQHKISQRGGATHKLTWHRNAEGGEVSDDGELMLFSESSLVDDRFQLYVRPTDGRPAIHLGVGTAFAISGDHAWTLIGNEPPITELELVPTGPGDRKRIPLGPIGEIDNAEFLHDGKRILFCEVKDGKHRIWVTDRSGTATPQPIGPVGLHLGGKPSPDDKLVIVNQDGGNRPFVFALDGKTPPRELVGPNDNTLGWHFAADSRSVLIPRFELAPGSETARAMVVKIDVVTRQVTPVRNLDEVHRTAENIFLSDYQVTPDQKTEVIGYTRIWSELYVVEGLR
jgi:eukaryotic-like serine/threonine-protein kinase